jgi:hypothetical protein
VVTPSHRFQPQAAKYGYVQIQRESRAVAAPEAWGDSRLETLRLAFSGRSGPLRIAYSIQRVASLMPRVFTGLMPARRAARRGRIRADVLVIASSVDGLRAVGTWQAEDIASRCLAW